MRRDVGGHPDGDSGGPINQQKLRSARGGGWGLGGYLAAEAGRSRSPAEAAISSRDDDLETSVWVWASRRTPRTRHKSTKRDENQQVQSATAPGSARSNDHNNRIALSPPFDTTTTTTTSKNNDRKSAYREAGGQHDRLVLVTVEVGHHVHRVQVDVRQEGVPRHHGQLALAQQYEQRDRERHARTRGASDFTPLGSSTEKSEGKSHGKKKDNKLDAVSISCPTRGPCSVIPYFNAVWCPCLLFPTTPCWQQQARRQNKPRYIALRLPDRYRCCRSCRGPGSAARSSRSPEPCAPARRTRQCHLGRRRYQVVCCH